MNVCRPSWIVNVRSRAKPSALHAVKHKARRNCFVPWGTPSADTPVCYSLDKTHVEKCAEKARSLAAKNSSTWFR
jgi:hypothetical protein